MKYILQDLIDIEHFQNLQDRLNEIYSFPSAIIDNDGNILTATAWQDLCTQFHRKNKDSEKLCIKSDQYIKDHIHQANPAVSYQCPHGLVDNATPIIIDGHHYGNFFTGQFFLEEPDLQFFRAQAQKFGFEEDAYLKAVESVPVWTQKQLDSYLFFIKGLIAVISESGLKTLKESENRKQIEVREKRHKSILKTVMDGFWLTDTKGRILEVNDAYCRMSGFSEDDLLMMYISDLEATENAQLVARHLQKVISQGSDRFESKHRRKDGTYFDVEVSVQFRPEEGGQCVCFLRDITERQKAEIALKESEAYMRSIFRAAPTGIGVVHDRVFRQVNDKFCEMLGYSRDELIGKQSILVYPSVEEFEKVGREKYELIKTDGTGTVETVMKRKNGELINVLMSSTPIEINSLSAGVTFTALDITASKQAEKALQDSHERFLTVLDSIDATIYVADMETYEILFMNKYMIDSFGQNMIGEMCWKVFRGESGPCLRCTNDKLFDKNNVPTGVVIWKDKNPITKKWYINHDRAIEWTDGRLVRLQIATDITEILSMEAQLRQAQKMESVGRLAGGVAHDFNNMLGVILGYTEMAQEKLEKSHPVSSDLDQILMAANRSTDITKQLLAFARKQIIAPKVVNLNETVLGMLKMLRRLIGEDIDLRWLPGERLWPIKIDASQIDQILANLCVNAKDAISGVGRIIVETGNCKLDEEYCSAHAGFVPGQYVKIEISDNGGGMDMETIAHIFEPFFTTKGVNEGTGLGLATVYGIVKQNNGFINVYSEQKQGTTFSIYLPRYVSKINTEEIEFKEESVIHGDETILLVEDEPAILNMTTIMLQSLGYTVLAADTPSEAVRLTADYSEEIHLLITDVIMPEMNGRILAETLMVNRPGLKCLFMSGYTAQVISQNGVLGDGVHFLQKPFSKRDLAAKIQQTLGNG